MLAGVGAWEVNDMEEGNLDPACPLVSLWCYIVTFLPGIWLVADGSELKGKVGIN
jgi:hypothetical protein